MSGRGSHLPGAAAKAGSSTVQFPHYFIYTGDSSWEDYPKDLVAEGRHHPFSVVKVPETS